MSHVVFLVDVSESVELKAAETQLEKIEKAIIEFKTE